MSRDKLDRYYTPDMLAVAIVDAVEEEIGRARWLKIQEVIEPSVGGGAFARPLGHGGKVVHGFDLDPNAPGLAACSSMTVRDWLEFQTVLADLIIGNPPYNRAEAHIRASLDRAPLVCFLLRASILGSQKRHALWTQHPPRRVWQVVGRPSFTGGGTDSSEYVVILWDRYWADEPRLGWLTWR